MRRSKKQNGASGGDFPQGSLLASLVNAATPIAYSCRVSGDCGMIAVTENVRDQFGYGPEEFLGDPGFWALRIHPADSVRVFDEIQGLFERGEETLEYRFRHANGRYVWLRDEMRLKMDASGTPDQILGRWTDVTGLKLAAASAAHFVFGKGTNEARGEDYAKQT
jgi:PAS domain S-box-containing protein